MIYKIFVKTKLKINDPVIYKSNNKYNIGDIVSVPFGKETTIGIIVDKLSTNEHNYNFKIKEIIEDSKTEYIPLSITELKILKHLITYYNGMISNSINPFITKRYHSKNDEIKDVNDYNRAVNIEKKILTEKQSFVVNEFISEINVKKYILLGVTGSGKTEIYIDLIKKYIQENKQVLILVPDITLTSQLFLKINLIFNENIISLIHSKISKKDKNIENNLIYENKKRIIIGARSAIFSRFNNLGLIIMDEFHDNSYKQEQDPRYDTIEIAEYISDLSKIKVLLGSATPRIDTYYRYLSNKNEYKIIKLNEKYKFNRETSFEIIDLKEEKLNYNKSIFSNKLKKYIQDIIEENGKLILYINRRGYSPITLCDQCGYSEECPRCNIPLNIHTLNPGNHSFYYKCHHCDYQKNIKELKCMSCGNKKIKFYGFGTQYVKNEIEKEFSAIKGDLNIFILDKDYNKNNKLSKDENIYDKLNNKNINIIIGTQLIIKGWDIDKVKLICLLNPDLELSFPDYRGYENSYQKLVQIFGRTSRKGNSGKVLIQTYDPENDILKKAIENNYESFFEEEIKNRKLFGYPPFSEIIKIQIKSKTEKTLNSRSKDIYKNLVNQNIDGIKIYYPVNSYPYRNNYLYSKNIIIKVNNNSSLIKKILRNNYNQDRYLSIDVLPIQLT